jgi:hypothetical protein
MNAEQHTEVAAAGQLKNHTELDRLYLLLADQNELLNTLEARLGPVLQPVPADPEKDSVDKKPHLSHAAEVVGRHNTHLRQILTELVI